MIYCSARGPDRRVSLTIKCCAERGCKWLLVVHSAWATESGRLVEEYAANGLRYARERSEQPSRVGNGWRGAKRSVGAVEQSREGGQMNDARGRLVFFGGFASIVAVKPPPKRVRGAVRSVPVRGTTR